MIAKVFLSIAHFEKIWKSSFPNSPNFPHHPSYTKADSPAYAKPVIRHRRAKRHTPCLVWQCLQNPSFPQLWKYFSPISQ